MLRQAQQTSGEWRVLARLRIEGDELLGGGDGVLVGEYGSASGFRADDVDKKRIIGEVDCCAEGHAGNA